MADVGGVKSRTVADIMSHPVVTAPAFAPAEDGLSMLREGTARHLVLVDGDALAGVLCRCGFDGAWNSWDLLVDLRKRLPIWVGPGCGQPSKMARRQPRLAEPATMPGGRFVVGSWMIP